VAAAVSEIFDPLTNQCGGDTRIFLQALRDEGLEGVQFALPLPCSGSLRWRIQILSDGSLAHVEMALNLTNGPFLGHVEKV
jgi:hypothetical protein